MSSVLIQLHAYMEMAIWLRARQAGCFSWFCQMNFGLNMESYRMAAAQKARKADSNQPATIKEEKR